ncbi:MAG: carbamoyltransferase HypF [Flavobacteriales bacterium]|nr:carbamoyltransferase HypF [Flavobacteriales bacterium]
MLRTFEIVLTGQVQGVGFRPFVYNLAIGMGLKGTVCNNADGVLIRFNTNIDKAEEFLEAILNKAPEVSKVITSSLKEVESEDYSAFRIVKSISDQKVNIPLTPDFAICKDCQTEIRDPKNRRYGYAFTTCTICGPRYSITTQFPFERANTSMSPFEMCIDCVSEYENPADRRFHSQTNSCPTCGIEMRLNDSKNSEVEKNQTEIIQKTAQLISEGKIVAIKNTNGYLLCCRGDSHEVVETLRQRKRRPSKPFAVLYPDLDQIKAAYDLSSNEERSLTSSVAPIMLLKPKNDVSNLSKNVATSLNRVGCMLPSSALLTLLMNELQMPVVATSGNIHGSPIIHSELEAIDKLHGVADYFLHHDLDITFPQDDSVVRFVGDQKIILRRSRGMAPNYFTTLDIGDEKVLAMGAHLKSTIAFVPNNHTYISPYFGNLDSYEVLERYKKTVLNYKELFQTQAETVLIDLHPQYQSSILGNELSSQWKASIRSVQHHKAHFGAVLGEHNLFDTDEKILGVIWDGAGLGEDGAIWGGEFFSYQNSTMKRVAHFDYVPWIAGDKMASEPRISLLAHLMEGNIAEVEEKFDEKELNLYRKLVEKNSLSTSSVGRLFDTVSSLLGLCDKSTYEGEAAMMLEALAEESDVCPLDFLPAYSGGNIPTRELVGNILLAVQSGVSKSQVATSFTYTLALVIVKMAKENTYKIIACSGGVFQNGLLVKYLQQLAKEYHLDLRFNHLLSCNDENISFGQLCCYHHLKL